jgi:pimeloyl-ACP methyl ester carboxylesterase
MAAWSAEERQRRVRRRRILQASLLAAGAVAVPLLWRRRRRLPSSAPMPGHGWGRGQTYLWRGQPVRFERIGQGDPPLVLLHSLGPGHDGDQWRRVAHIAGRRHEVVAPDLPGWGRSQPLALAASPFLYTTFLADFFDEVVRRPAVVVAVGASAAFAVRLAGEHPARVAALALVCPLGLAPAGGAAPGDRLASLLELPLLGPAALHLLTSRRAVRRHLLEEVFAAPERVDAGRVEHYARAARQPGASGPLRALWTGQLDLEVEDALARLPQPVWLAWGRQCVWPPVEDADRWLRHLEGAGLDVFEQAGLLPHAETARQFCDRLEEFLRHLPAAAGAPDATRRKSP